MREIIAEPSIKELLLHCFPKDPCVQYTEVRSISSVSSIQVTLTSLHLNPPTLQESIHRRILLELTKLMHKPSY